MILGELRIAADFQAVPSLTARGSEKLTGSVGLPLSGWERSPALPWKAVNPGGGEAASAAYGSSAVAFRTPPLMASLPAGQATVSTARSPSTAPKWKS